MRCVHMQNTVTKYRVSAVTESASHGGRLVVIVHKCNDMGATQGATELEVQNQQGIFSKRLSQTYCDC